MLCSVTIDELPYADILVAQRGGVEATENTGRDLRRRCALRGIRASPVTNQNATVSFNALGKGYRADMPGAAAGTVRSYPLVISLFVGSMGG